MITNMTQMSSGQSNRRAGRTLRAQDVHVHVPGHPCDLRDHFLNFWSGEKHVNRKTTQKMAILKALYTSHQPHLTAEELFHQVKRQLPGMSETTVYRSLKRLVEEGLAVRRQLVPEVDHYERIREPHAHVVCKECRKINNVPWTGSQAGRKPISGYTITHTSLTFHGVCDACLKK